MLFFRRLRMEFNLALLFASIQPKPTKPTKVDQRRHEPEIYRSETAIKWCVYSI